MSLTIHRYVVEDVNQFYNLWSGKTDWLVIPFDAVFDDCFSQGDILKLRYNVKILKGTVESVNTTLTHRIHRETNRAVTCTLIEIKLKDIEKLRG